MSLHRDWRWVCGLIGIFEGYESRPYKCPADKYTIGYGSTILLDGKRVTANTPPITKAEAQELLVFHLEKYCWPEIENLELNRWQNSAVLSFIFNVGAGNFKKSTMRKLILAGDVDKVAKEFPKWRKAAGKVVKGLVNRRRVERAVFVGTCKTLTEARKIFAE